MMPRTYVSSDDSALLRTALEAYTGGVCLEIGAGNGGGLAALSGGFGHVVGTDIETPGDSTWSREAVDYVLADAAGCFREGAFDLIAFNPPYVPSQEIEDRAVDGGPGGLAVALQFLAEAIRVVKREGKIVALLSSDNPLARVRELCQRNGLAMQLITSKHLFYENLGVYEISRQEAEARFPTAGRPH